MSTAFKEAVYNAFALCLSQEGIEAQTEVTLSFILPEEIQELNRTYRNTDKETDVLSFPVFTSKEDILEQDDTLPVLLGDVMINPLRAEEQAAAYGHSFEREALYLALHSILHLLGYDHMETADKTVMRSREKELLRVLGVCDET